MIGWGFRIGTLIFSTAKARSRYNLGKNELVMGRKFIVIDKIILFGLFFRITTSYT